MYTHTIKKKVKKKSKAAIIELNSELNPGLEFFKLLNVKGIAGNKGIYKKYLQKGIVLQFKESYNFMMRTFFFPIKRMKK